MRGGALPPALLASSLALALAVSPAGGRWRCVVLFALTAASISMMPLPISWREEVFGACWVSVIGTVATVHTPAVLKASLPSWLSLNAGLWAGGVIAIAGSRLDVFNAVPCILLVGPAGWLVHRYGSMPAKVAASWLIAIAILCAALPYLRVTPGYLPDHLE